MQHSMKIFVIAAIAFLFAFAACRGDGKGKPAPCAKHTWGEWTVKTAADETTDGEEERTCTACGEEETQFGEYAAGTAGLAYERIGNGKAYRVRKGTVTEGEVVIPAFYRPNARSPYLPVTEVGVLDLDELAAAFYNTAITGVTFLTPSNITGIGDRAFSDTALTSIAIPDSVTSIGKSAFSDCAALTSVIIPASVERIGGALFRRCTALTNITVDKSNPNYYSVNGIVYTKEDQAVLVEALAGITGALTIHRGVRSIGESAFECCDALTSVTIPEGVTFIGHRAFLNCTALASVTVLRETPPVLDGLSEGAGHNVTFEGNHASRQIFVPAGSVAAYKAAANWSHYADRIAAITQ